MSRRALVLGGGVGGVVTARTIRRQLPDEDEVVVIDRDPHHLFQPSLPWMLTGERTPEEIRRPVDRDTLATESHSVYAVGDVNRVELEMGKALPMAGVFAPGEAKLVAGHLAANWTGDGEQVCFHGHGTCWVETGDGRAAFATATSSPSRRPRSASTRPAAGGTGARFCTRSTGCGAGSKRRPPARR